MPRTPPRSSRGSPPASSTSTLHPASASRAATVPPPAPEPTITKSKSSSLALAVIAGLPSLQGLQELDQVELLRVGQAGLLGEPVGSEVMAAIDHQVLAFAELEQRLDQVCERLARVLVAGVLRDRAQIADRLDQETQQLAVVL